MKFAISSDISPRCGEAMIEIWGRRNSANVMPVMWAVGELGLDHVRYDVGGSFGGLDTDEYRRINPTGQIPAIRDGGFVLWESNAIIRYLYARYDHLDRSEESFAVADQWMDWFKSTLFQPYISLFRGIVRTEPERRDHQALSSWNRQVGDALSLLDQQLARHPYVAGDSFTMADIPLGAMISRYLNLDVEHPEMPDVRQWYQRLAERKPYRKHVMFPFGSNPSEWDRLERDASASADGGQLEKRPML